MNNRRLRILQLNIRKTRASTEAFINDSDTNKFDILLVQEPSTSKYRPHVQHRQWQLYKPTRSDDNKRERSILYINKRLSSASYRQIDCDSTDVVAISILTPMSKFLIFSVYTPPIDVCTAANGTELQPTLEAINQTIQEASPEIGDRLRVIIAGDFNRHHPPGDTTESTATEWETRRNFSSSCKTKNFKTACQEALRPTGHSHFLDRIQPLILHYQTCQSDYSNATCMGSPSAQITEE